MPIIAICSLIRDGRHYVENYRAQLNALKLPPDYEWRLFILEGDSKDDSWAYLKKWASEDPRVTIGKSDVGPSTEIQDRAARWARAGNACLDLIPQDLNYSHLLWIEADLVFPAETLKRLLDQDVDIIAPMIWLGGLFYDTWGFRDLSNKKWTNEAPYHPQYRPLTLLEMGSVGSCVLFRGEILRKGIRFRGPYENGLLVGMCQDARKLGYRVFSDTSTAILHPVDLWQEQMWKPSAVRIQIKDEQPRTISLGQARSMGLNDALPVLDATTFFQANRRYLVKLGLEHRTNALEVVLNPSSTLKKTYELELIALPFSMRTFWRELFGKIKFNTKRTDFFTHLLVSLKIRVADIR